ncbi:transposase [Pyramidobacter piscolens]|nr:transposase [Pyramidobacter piscolens]
MNKLFEIVPGKTNRRWLFALAAVVVAAVLTIWYWRGYRGHGETDAVIGRLRESAATAERRADAIIDATARREVTARETTRKKTADLPADKLCDALSAMLADYRADY